MKTGASCLLKYCAKASIYLRGLNCLSSWNIRDAILAYSLLHLFYLSGQAQGKAAENDPKPIGASEEGSESFVTLSGHVQISESMWDRPGAHFGSTNQNWTVKFVAVVSRKTWYLEGDFLKNSIERWHFDGTNVSRSIRMTETAAPTQLGGLPFEAVASNLTVSLFPAEIDYMPGGIEENIVWLALCSSSYLQKPSRVIPLPTAQIGNTPDAFAYKDETETFEDDFRLPRAVNLITSATGYTAAVEDFWKGHLPENKRLLLSPYPEGQVKFHYLVTRTTNVLGWTFPLEFRFGEDLPSAFRFPRFAAYSGTGEIVSAVPSEKPQGVFMQEMNQLVVDRRFAHVGTAADGVMYKWTNASAPPTNDPQLQLQLDKHVKIVMHQRWMRANSGRILFALFMLAIVVPLAISYRNARKKAQH